MPLKRTLDFLSKKIWKLARICIFLAREIEAKTTTINLTYKKHKKHIGNRGNAHKKFRSRDSYFLFQNQFYSAVGKVCGFPVCGFDETWWKWALKPVQHTVDGKYSCSLIGPFQGINRDNEDYFLTLSTQFQIQNKCLSFYGFRTGGNTGRQDPPPLVKTVLFQCPRRILEPIQGKKLRKITPPPPLPPGTVPC